MKSRAGMLLALAVIGVVAVAGCGGGSEKTNQTGAATAVSVEGVALDANKAKFWRLVKRAIRENRRLQDEAVRRTKSSLLENLYRSDRRAGVYVFRNVGIAAFLELQPWLEQNAATFPPEWLYAFAERLYPKQPRRAVFWWMVGQTRLRYDILRCIDRSYIEDQIARLDDPMRRLIKKSKSDIGSYATEASKALTWDQTHPPHSVKLFPFCINGKRFSVAVERRQQIWVSKRFGTPVRKGAPFDVPLPNLEDPTHWIRLAHEFPRLRADSRLPLIEFIRTQGGG